MTGGRGGGGVEQARAWRVLHLNTLHPPLLRRFNYSYLSSSIQRISGLHPSVRAPLNLHLHLYFLPVTRPPPRAPSGSPYQRSEPNGKHKGRYSLFPVGIHANANTPNKVYFLNFVEVFFLHWRIYLQWPRLSKVGFALFLELSPIINLSHSRVRSDNDSELSSSRKSLVVSYFTS